MEKQIRHLVYCMDCEKDIRDTTIPVSRAYHLVENPRNLHERYVLVDNRETGEEELIEESVCDPCYRELQARERQRRMEEEVERSLAAHERELERYFQNGRWQ